MCLATKGCLSELRHSFTAGIRAEPWLHVARTDLIILVNSNRNRHVVEVAVFSNILVIAITDSRTDLLGMSFEFEYATSSRQTQF